MRNWARVLAFDVAAPLAVIGGLLAIGVMLGWPAWWISVCSMLCLLVAQGMVVNAVLFRRDSVTVGTDDDAPGIRLAVVSLATATLVAAVLVGYYRWTVPDRAFARDTAEVVRIASEVAEATATFSPSDPTSAIDRAAATMVPESAAAFKAQFGSATKDMAKRNVTAEAGTVAAGLEALGPAEASVAVLIRATQTAPGEQPSSAVLGLRVALTKQPAEAQQDGGWRVVDVSPINSR